MKIFIKDTVEADAILEEIEAFNFVEFTRDGNEVTIHLQSEKSHSVANIFISLMKDIPDLILE